MTRLLPALFLGAVLYPDALPAACMVDRGGNGAGAAFTLRLSGSCTEAEREAQAIPAADLLRALASGKGIDVAGVVIKGDLLLDTLPVQRMAEVKNLTPQDRRVLEELADETIQMVRGPFVIKNARVQGRIVNRNKRGFLMMTGPVVLAQTRFEGAVDLSRTVFLGLVDGSGATFEQESYFIQNHFTQSVMLSNTHFGPHTRFHRSIFSGPAIFRDAVFNGLTEFLEVVFEQEANFSHASFLMGTGFSGAHCRAKCDFSLAEFNREAFFLFALFDRPVLFSSARFNAQADFSDASFKEPDTLAQAIFAQPPLLARTARVTVTAPGQVEGTSSSRALTIALFLTAFGLLVYIIRAR